MYDQSILLYSGQDYVSAFKKNTCLWGYQNYPEVILLMFNPDPHSPSVPLVHFIHANCTMFYVLCWIGVITMRKKLSPVISKEDSWGIRDFQVFKLSVG